MTIIKRQEQRVVSTDDMLASERAMQRICAAMNSGKGSHDKLVAIDEVVQAWVFHPERLRAELGQISAPGHHDPRDG